MTLAIEQLSNVRQQVGQMRFRGFASSQSFASVNAFDTACEFMQSLADGQAIPAQLLLGAIRYPVKDIPDRSSHEQPFCMTLERACRRLQQILEHTDLRHPD